MEYQNNIDDEYMDFSHLFQSNYNSKGNHTEEEYKPESLE